MVIAWKNIGHDTQTGLSISVSNFKCFVAKAQYILNHRLALNKQVLFTEIYLSKKNKKVLYLGIVCYSRRRREYPISVPLFLPAEVSFWGTRVNNCIPENKILCLTWTDRHLTDNIRGPVETPPSSGGSEASIPSTRLNNV